MSAVDLFLWLFAGMAVLAAGYFFIARLRVLDAIKRLTRVSADFVRGDMSARSAVRGSNQVNELELNFNSLALHVAELEKSRFDFFHKAVHDLKSPLDNIKQSADALLNDVAGQELSSTQRELVQIIKQSSTNLRNFIQRQLDEADFAEGEIQLNIRDTHIKDLVTERIQLQKPMARLRENSFVIKHNVDEPVIACDPDKITRVIDNLVTNAIKYSPEQSTIEIALEDRAEELEFRIRNQGLGIPNRFRKTIFEKYVRLPQSQHLPGSGLGLYIAKQIVELHGGEIGVSSVADGSVFFFRIPKRAGSQALIASR